MIKINRYYLNIDVFALSSPSDKVVWEMFPAASLAEAKSSTLISTVILDSEINMLKIRLRDDCTQFYLVLCSN